MSGSSLEAPEGPEGAGLLLSTLPDCDNPDEVQHAIYMHKTLGAILGVSWLQDQDSAHWPARATGHEQDPGIVEIWEDFMRFGWLNQSKACTEKLSQLAAPSAADQSEDAGGTSGAGPTALQSPGSRGEEVNVTLVTYPMTRKAFWAKELEKELETRPKELIHHLYCHQWAVSRASADGPFLFRYIRPDSEGGTCGGNIQEHGRGDADSAAASLDSTDAD